MAERGEKKLYILARRDLSCAERAVQACHALAELMSKYGDDPQLREWAERHRTLIILGVPDEKALTRWEQKLRDAQIKCEAFTEPEMGNEKTALAVYPSAGGDLFRALRLL